MSQNIEQNLFLQYLSGPRLVKKIDREIDQRIVVATGCCVLLLFAACVLVAAACCFLRVCVHMLQY